MENEYPDSWLEYAEQFYEAAKNIPFQAWIQLMAPMWENELGKAGLEGEFRGLANPAEEE